MAVSSVTSASTDLAAQTSAAPGDASDRFLKLLVAQMQNQDPLNPMDNAQVTSQMAQINTVTGIEKLNSSVAGLSSQFMQMQALQGASLVGRDVTVDGNRLTPVGDQLEAGFMLGGPADAVQVDVLNPAGQVVDTLQLGAQDGGRQGFSWSPPAGADLDSFSFRVSATLGSAKVQSAPLMLDRVSSVGLDGASGLVLTLERSGPVPYGNIVALN